MSHEEKSDKAAKIRRCSSGWLLRIEEAEEEEEEEEEEEVPLLATEKTPQFFAGLEM